jgi:hypothetical protein
MYFGDHLAFFFLAVGAGKLAMISLYFLFAAIRAVVGGVGVLVEVETVVKPEVGTLVDMVGGKKKAHLGCSIQKETTGHDHVQCHDTLNIHEVLKRLSYGHCEYKKYCYSGNTYQNYL